MIEPSYCCHVRKLDYDDPIWAPIPVQHFVGSQTSEITTAEALDYWNYLAQVFLEFCRVHDGVLADPIGYHCDLLCDLQPLTADARTQLGGSMVSSQVSLAWPWARGVPL